MSIYLNEESDFTGPLENTTELDNMSIRVEVYYWVDEDGCVHLDIDGILDEIKHHVYELKTIVDEFNEENGFMV